MSMDTGQKMTLGYRIKDANNYTEEPAHACSQCVYVKRCSLDDYRCKRNPDVIIAVKPHGRCDKFEKSPQEGINQ